MSSVIVLFVFVIIGRQITHVDGLGCNLGTQTTHFLPGEIIVNLMQENGFDKVKLFVADPRALGALGGSGMQVMAGIPNFMLASFASSPQLAQQWVSKNVSYYLSQKVDIRYVALGNEPLLKSYNNSFTNVTFPALQNVQAALNDAGLSKTVKATVPLNADIFESYTGLPSGGIFRADIQDLMASIVKLLNDNVTFYDPNFPMDYAFFDGTPSPLVDGSAVYTNALDGNLDTLVWALEKNGFPSLPIIVGEVGWPTDGDPKANPTLARKFNQGLINKIKQGKGTPKRQTLPDIYIFSLIDEDAKGIEPGNFERHWGLFNLDGTVKYPVDLGGGKNLTGAKGVQYLPRQWCVMDPNASVSDPNLDPSVKYACTHVDCTSLTYGSSCSGLDARGTASYAFNKYFQTMNQQSGRCEQFHNLSVITKTDPGSQGGSCWFEIMVDPKMNDQASGHDDKSSGDSSSAGKMSWPVFCGLVLVLSGYNFGF
ncbi:hypothetical protein ABFS82_12G132800 [Erythranthe guttata]